MVSRSIFALYDWNEVPVDETEISQSVVDISRNLPFTIDISPSRSREGISELHKSLDRFDYSYHLLFRQIDLFKVLVSERRM